jgi:predicted MFS family arabinose efflux permease
LGPVVWSVSLDYLLTYLGYFGLLPVLAIFLTRELGAQPSELGLLLFLFSLAVRGSSVMVGTALDRVPLKATTVGALLLAAAAFALTPLATTALQALPLLVLAGFGFSLHGVAARSLVAEHVKERSASLRAFALVNMFVNVAAAVGPVLGGLVLGTDHLRMAPLVVAGGCVAAAMVIVLAAPGQPRDGKPRVDPLDASVSRRRRLPFAVYARMFADPGFRRLSVVNFVGWFLYAQLFTALPIYLFNQLGSTSVAAILFSLNGALIILFQWPVSAAVGRRLARDTSPVPSSLVLGVGLLALSLPVIAAASAQPALLYVAVVVFTLGEMVFVPTSDSVYAGFGSGTQRISVYNGKKITTALGESVGAFCGASVSLLVAQSLGPSAYWMVAGVLGLASTPLLSRMARGASNPGTPSAPVAAPEAAT